MGIYTLSSSCSSWTLATSYVYLVTSLDRQCIFIHPLCITSVSVRIVLVLSKINSHVVNSMKIGLSQCLLFQCPSVSAFPFLRRAFYPSTGTLVCNFLHPSIPTSVCLGACVHLSGQLPVHRSVNSIHSSIPVRSCSCTLVSQTSVDLFVHVSSLTIVWLFVLLLVGFLSVCASPFICNSVRLEIGVISSGHPSVHPSVQISPWMLMLLQLVFFLKNLMLLVVLKYTLMENWNE